MVMAWIRDERFMWHDTGTGAGPLPARGWIEPVEHVEGPAAKRRFANLVSASGLLTHLLPVPARRARDIDIERVHTRDHRVRIEQQAATGRGDAGGGSSLFGRESHDVALLAAGGVIAAVDAVIEGTAANASALVRPPGHQDGAHPPGSGRVSETGGARAAGTNLNVPLPAGSRAHVLSRKSSAGPSNRASGVRSPPTSPSAAR